mgnify:CR=1 FL=1
MEFDPGQPIWLQLVREFTRRIATGAWPAGERVPSVRDLASELGVNPNTVQRALAELERTRLAVAERRGTRCDLLRPVARAAACRRSDPRPDEHGQSRAVGRQPG